MNVNIENKTTKEYNYDNFSINEYYKNDQLDYISIRKESYLGSLTIRNKENIEELIEILQKLKERIQ